MNINIINHSKYLKNIPRKKIDFIINQILIAEKKTPNRFYKRLLTQVPFNQIEINILFVDEKEMAEYNKKYFNRNQVTDVIAFSMIEGLDLINNSVLGDAVICLETAKKNSVIFHNSFLDEITLLIIHAVLHLLGFEHEGKQDHCSLMRKKETHYFNLIKKKK